MANAERAETRPFPNKDPDLICGLAMDRLQTQQRQIDALDGKIGNLLGFASALVAILAAFLALNEDDILCISLIFLCISGAAYIGIVLGSLFTYYTRPWEVGPTLHESWRYAHKYEEKQLGWWAAESFTRSYENNQERVNWKVRVVKINVTLIAMQTISLGLCLSLIALN